jgi:hypothetical protein
MGHIRTIWDTRNWAHKLSRHVLRTP